MKVSLHYQDSDIDSTISVIGIYTSTILWFGLGFKGPFCFNKLINLILFRHSRNKKNIRDIIDFVGFLAGGFFMPTNVFGRCGTFGLGVWAQEMWLKYRNRMYQYTGLWYGFFPMGFPVPWVHPLDVSRANAEVY